MRIHYWVVILFILCISGLFSCTTDLEQKRNDQLWLASQDSLTVAVFPYYAPYQFRNRENIVDGLLVDYLELVEREIGYTFKKVEYTDWPLLLEHAQSGKIDVILEIQSTEDRLEYLEFHDLFIESQQVLVTRKRDSMEAMEDLSGKTMILPKDYAIIGQINESFPEVLIETAPTDSVSMRLLGGGLYDAYVGPRAVVNYNKSNMRLNNLKIKKNLPFSYKPQIAISKEKAELNSIFGRAINNITDEKKQKLINRWLFSETKPFYLNYRFWYRIGYVLLGLLFIFGVLAIYLRYRVKESTKELQEATDTALESQNLRTQFTQNISHEIRTPMNGIVGFANLLQTRPTHGTERHLFLNTITESGSQLDKTASKIFEISNLQLNEVSITKSRVDFMSFLQELIKSFEKPLIKKEIQIQIKEEARTAGLAVLTDRDKLGTILGGLLDNAIKFTKRGTVQIQYEHDGSYLVVMVKDSGIGISSLDKDKIFTSYSQLHEKISQRYNGLGLGLTIAMENAILLDGSISFNSKKDTGSVFKLKIPCSRIDKEFYKKRSAP